MSDLRNRRCPPQALRGGLLRKRASANGTMRLVEIARHRSAICNRSVAPAPKQGFGLPIRARPQLRKRVDVCSNGGSGHFRKAPSLAAIADPFAEGKQRFD